MKRRMICLALSILLNKVCFSQNECGVCEQLKNNVVKIATNFSDGSDENGFGTIIAEKGDKLYIVTAKHVIYKLDERGNKISEINPKWVNIRFYTDQGKDYPAQLLSLSDNIYDITLLEVTKPQNFTWTKNYYSDAVKRGTQVWFIGQAGQWYIPTGPKTGAINSVSINDEIIIDINSIQPGTSGAPLINEDGMVGVIFEDASTGAKAYPIERVKKIITNWNYEWQMKLFTNKSASDQVGQDKEAKKNNPNSSYEIGMKYGGGIIFYIDSSGKHGLIAAPSDQSKDAKWGCPGIISRADGTELGTGILNTYNITSFCSEPAIAARICRDLELGGYTDWYLPSIEELKKLYLNRKKVGGFGVGFYWSSSEVDSLEAYVYIFGNGLRYKSGKDRGYTNVRAVRDF